eukprot:6913317-Pyramimonas_sp.AAC.1
MLAPTSDRESSRTGGEDAKERPPVRVVDCAGLGSGVEALVDLGVVDRAGVEALVDPGVVDCAGLGLDFKALVDPGGRPC